MSNNYPMVNRPLKTAICFLAFFILNTFNSKAYAQEIILDQQDLTDNYESSCYEGHISFFPSINCTNEIKGHFNLLPLYTNTVYNSEYARGLNDGPAWQGKGVNFTTSIGFSGRWKSLTYVINPIVQYNQNQPFDTGVDLTDRGNPNQYPFASNIDYVVRYGQNSNVNIYPGQSEIAFSLNPIMFSLSTQNMRWGPAIYNPILMSTNAGGFPHFSIGTNEVLKTAIGDFDGQIIWGLIKESDYFNDNSEDDYRYFTGISVGFRPVFFKELSITIHRSLYAQTQFLTGFFDNGFAVFSGIIAPDEGKTINGRFFPNDIYDQNMSLSMKYMNEDDNFSLYWEWGIGDFPAGISNFLEHPDDVAGFTIGFWKEFTLSNIHDFRLIYEHSALATWDTRFTAGFGAPSLYVHGVNQQGYTNNGQIIGASIGPGGNSDEFKLTYLWEKSSLSFEYQRTRFNDDYFFTQVAGNQKRPFDLEHHVGFQYSSKQFKRVTYNIAFFTGIRNNYLYQDPVLKVNIHSKAAFRYHF